MSHLDKMNRDLITTQMNRDHYPSLEFHPAQCIYRSISEGHTVTERIISWEVVRAAATNIPVESGWLNAQHVRWGTGKNHDWLVAFIPPGRHALEITNGTPGEDEVIERIVAPLPGMLIFGLAIKYWIWAVKYDEFDPRRGPFMELYRCPLPNVMADGSICWGELKPPQVSPANILRAFDLFIGSTFNNHAANGKSRMQKEDIRVLLRELHKADAEMEKRLMDLMTGWLDHLSPSSEGKGFESELLRHTFGFKSDRDLAEQLLKRHVTTLQAIKYPVEDMQRQVPQTGVALDKALRDFFASGKMPGGPSGEAE